MTSQGFLGWGDFSIALYGSCLEFVIASKMGSRTLSGGLDDWVGCYIYTYVIHICIYITYIYTDACIFIYIYRMKDRKVICKSPHFRNLIGNHPPSCQYLVHLDSRFQIGRQPILSTCHKHVGDSHDKLVPHS